MLNIIKNRNYFILLVSRCFSNMGSSFYLVSAMWLVHELGESTFYTGVALFLTQVPALLQVILGPIIDKLRVKHLLIYTQFLQAVLLLVIPLFYMLDLLSVLIIFIIMPIISLCNQFIYPIQLSILPKILKKEQLTSGNSLFAIAYQGTDALFRSISGILLSLIGAISLFYINSFTFVISGFILMGLVLPFAQSREEVSTVAEAKLPLKMIAVDYISELKEGITVLFHPLLIRLLIGVLFVNLAGASLYAILPAFSDTHGGPMYYGFFMAASGAGMIIGSYSASIFKIERFKLGILYAVLILFEGLCWILITITPSSLGVILFGLGWIPAGVINVITQVALQSIIPPHLIGRVMAAVLGLSMGIAPLGGLFGGALGAFTGSKGVIIIGSVILILVSIYWLMNKQVGALPPTKEITAEYIGMQ